MAQAVVDRLPEDEHRIQLRRAVVASTIGTAIEWYDFFLYSTVTGLVFAKLFFPTPIRWSGRSKPLRSMPSASWRVPWARPFLGITATASAASKR